jgi:hypothetical protein
MSGDARRIIAFRRIFHRGAANFWGSTVYTTAQLKTMQEVITHLRRLLVLCLPEEEHPDSRRVGVVLYNSGKSGSSGRIARKQVSSQPHRIHVDASIAETTAGK